MKEISQPAFPQDIAGRRSDNPWFEGMSLRDWFAGQALSGYIASHAHPQAVNPPNPIKAACEAYEYTDAMLSKRNEP